MAAMRESKICVLLWLTAFALVCNIGAGDNDTNETNGGDTFGTNTTTPAPTTDGTNETTPAPTTDGTNETTPAPTPTPTPTTTQTPTPTPITDGTEATNETDGTDGTGEPEQVLEGILELTFSEADAKKLMDAIGDATKKAKIYTAFAESIASTLEVNADTVEVIDVYTARRRLGGWRRLSSKSVKVDYKLTVPKDTSANDLADKVVSMSPAMFKEKTKAKLASTGVDVTVEAMETPQAPTIKVIQDTNSTGNDTTTKTIIKKKDVLASKATLAQSFVAVPLMAFAGWLASC